MPYSSVSDPEQSRLKIEHRYSDDQPTDEAAKEKTGPAMALNKFRGALMNYEIRSVAELRADGDAEKGMSLTGYAAVFNSPSKNLGGFVEIVAPGAFKRSLSNTGHDVKCLFNHDANRVLGSSAAGTLTVEEDQRGLKFACRLDPNQQSHRDIHASVQRGDIRDCSFAFNAPESGQEWTDGKDERGNYRAQRRLTDVDLYDVSAVTYPAYNTTSVVARSVEQRAAKAGLPLANETRQEDGDSLEEIIREIQGAITEKFPREDANATTQPCGGVYDGRFWVCETYESFVIVSDNHTNEYFRIPYMEDGDKFTFGTPVPVEKEWVDSERFQKLVTERRAINAALLAHLAAAHKTAADDHASTAAAHQAHADTHAAAGEQLQAEAERMEKCSATNGNCEERDCRCQNVMVRSNQAWQEDPEDALDDLDGDTDEERARKVTVRERRAAYIGTLEQRDDQVRTKTVDGKALTKDRFAYVGDPEKTETWKFPIHDADHARNALARWGQAALPEEAKAGVLRKIKASAKKFGIEVSADQRALYETLPMDEEEVQDTLMRLEVAMRSDEAFAAEKKTDVVTEQRYSEDQPRDDHGRFADGEGDVASGGGFTEKGWKSVEEAAEAMKGGFSAGSQKTGAHVQYAAASKMVAAKLAQLQAKLKVHEAQGNKNWGHVGDLAHINEQLGALSNFMGDGKSGHRSDAALTEQRYSEDQPRVGNTDRV